jgi:hypothetical protein
MAGMGGKLPSALRKIKALQRLAKEAGLAMAIALAFAVIAITLIE